MARHFALFTGFLVLGCSVPAWAEPPAQPAATRPGASAASKPGAAVPKQALSAAAVDADQKRRSQIVAKVGEAKITVGDLEDHIAEQSPLLRARYSDPAELKALLDSLIRFELLAVEAERRGYGKNASVVRTVKDSAVASLMRQEIDGKISPGSVSEAEVRSYYEANANEFHRVAIRRASHILVETEAEAKQLLAEAVKADSRAFGDLARKHSKDLETRLRGGDLGYFSEKPSDAQSEARVHEALRKAAFSLKAVGDTVTKPVPVDGRFSILRVTGDRPAQTTTLQEAEPAIRTRLWREKRQAASTAFVDALRSKEQPVVNADLVDLVKLDDMDKGPLGGSKDVPAAAATKAGGE